MVSHLLTKTPCTQRIVVFYSRLMGVGGAERVAVEETRHLSENYDVTLLSFKSSPEALFGYKNLKMKAVRTSFSDERHYRNLVWSLGRAVALAGELRRTKPNLVIACSTAGLNELFLASLVYPVPYMLHIHGTIFWFENDPVKFATIYKRAFNKIRESLRGHMEFVPPNISLTLLQRVKTELVAIMNYLAVRRAKTVLVLSNRMKWEVKELYKKDATVMPLRLVPPQFLRPTPTKDIKKALGIHKDAKVILSISRLDIRKRIDLLIKAFEKSCLAMEDVVLVIAGKGSEEPHLKALAKKVGIGERVKFVGFVPESELLDYYGACDVFTYPGWGDFALTVHEALALNKKIVCSSEMEIPQHEGIFKAEPTVEDFALALERAVNSEATVSSEEIFKSNSFEQLEQLIQMLLAKK